MPSDFRLFPLILLSTLASSVLASSQVMPSLTESDAQPPAGSSPVAFVYVTSNPSGSNYEINAYAAASTGKLTTIPGSPFSADVQYMAVNGKYLFATNGIDIDSFTIASNGSLTFAASINAQQLNQGDCGGPGQIFLDHSGETLYDMDYLGNICANNPYQSFGVDNAVGSLTYLGVTAAASPQFDTPLSFISDNNYAYGSSCYHFNPEIYGFARNSDQTLSLLNNNPPMPEAQTGDFFCPYLAAADPAGHLVVPVQELTGNWGTASLPQLAVYTADSAGNLTTTSTYANMPKMQVGAVINLSMAPSGKLLAVSGTSGMQVFHVNGANPLTHYTSLITTDQVTQMFWDNDNHLYAISNAGHVFVYAITPSKISPVAGSPYSITKPQNIIVLPKT
jgi:hypothetical protein